MDDMKDISDRINMFDMPVCPLCDNDMMATDRVELVTAHGSIFLVHADCMEDSK